MEGLRDGEDENGDERSDSMGAYVYLFDRLYTNSSETKYGSTMKVK